MPNFCEKINGDEGGLSIEYYLIREESVPMDT